MRKTSYTFRLTKKHIVIAGLTAILGLAVYSNYYLSNNSGLKPTEVVNGLEGESDVIYVNGTEYQNLSSEDYFAQARLDKSQSRDEAVETLKMVLSGGDITEEEIAVYAEEAITLTSTIESESEIENLIIAAGYSDCVVYLDSDNASIVVKTDGLSSSQAAQIKDILLSEVNISSENIRIFEVN